MSEQAAEYVGTRGHYCGQVQPHPAHVWQTPPVYGSATVISTYQCAGLSAVVADCERCEGSAPLDHPLTFILCPDCNEPSSAGHLHRGHVRSAGQLGTMTDPYGRDFERVNPPGQGA